MSSPYRIYLDTSVLVCYFKPYHRPFGLRAQQFFNLLQEGAFRAVISDFCLMELLRGIRKACVDLEGRKDPDVWDKEYRIALEELFRMKNCDMISEEVFSETTKPCFFTEFMLEIRRMMEKYRGRANERENRLGYVWKGLGTPDCTHVFLAKRYGCDLIATFDHDFEECEREIEPFFVDGDLSLIRT